MRGCRSRTRRVVDAEPRDGADAQVFEHDVGAVEQPEKERLALRVLQIEREALLVAIQVDEVRRLRRRRTAVPRRARFRRRAARS